MSFQEVVPGHVTFVGLENFRNLFNADFYKAVSNSLIYTVITIAVLIPLPLVLSVLLDSKKWLERTFPRSIVFAGIGICCCWRFYLQIDFGEMPTALLNSILALFGVQPVKWLGGPAQWTTFSHCLHCVPGVGWG